MTKLVLDDDLTYTGDATIFYEYDDLYRLTKEQCVPAPGSYRFAFTYLYWYDAAGNRTKFSRTDKWTTNRISVYEYSQRNELTRYSDPEGYNRYWVFEYDMRGNLTKKYHTYYTSSWYEYYWDSRDKLTKVVNNSAGKTIYFKYDALGRRVAKKVDNGPWRWYFYDGLKVLAEGSDTYDRTFYTLAPGAIGGIICRDGGSKYFYHYDRLGNVVGVTDASGNVVRVYHNTAFGIYWAYDSDGYDQEVSDVQPYHLTTKEYDSDVGLYYFSARWYARWPGRFLSPDQMKRSENAYVFCLNNPLGLVDPDGQKIAPVTGVQQCTDAEAQNELQQMISIVWPMIRRAQMAGGYGFLESGCGNQANFMYDYLSQAIIAASVKCWECETCKGQNFLHMVHKFVVCRRACRDWDDADNVVFDSWDLGTWFSGMPSLHVRDLYSVLKRWGAKYQCGEYVTYAGAP